MRERERGGGRGGRKRARERWTDEHKYRCQRQRRTQLVSRSETHPSSPQDRKSRRAGNWMWNLSSGLRRFPADMVTPGAVKDHTPSLQHHNQVCLTSDRLQHHKQGCLTLDRLRHHDQVCQTSDRIEHHDHVNLTSKELQFHSGLKQHHAVLSHTLHDSSAEVWLHFSMSKQWITPSITQGSQLRSHTTPVSIITVLEF